MRPKHYIRELGEKVDSKENRSKFAKMFREDADELLASMGRPDEPVNESHVKKALEMMRRKWESLAAKCGKSLDEKIWESFEKGFLKTHTG